MTTKRETGAIIEKMIRPLARKDKNGNEYYLPDHSRSITKIGSRILPLLKSGRPTTVFSFDAINIFQFVKHFHGKIDFSQLEVLSSVFPTGSASAYSSIFFGKTVQEHKVYGSAYYNPTLVALQSVLFDQAFTLQGEPFEAQFKTTERSILNSSVRPTNFIQIKYAATDIALARSFEGSAKRTDLSPQDSYEEDIMSQLDVLRMTLREDGRTNNWCYLDFDTIMHRMGTKSEKTTTLLRNTAREITDICRTNSGTNYVFLSDHGQIDQEDVKRFDYASIHDKCYAMNGGSGRTLYIYSREKGAMQQVRETVGDTGIVLTRGDPHLDEIFGFRTNGVKEIGDVVAIATNPSFPSYGYNLKAEHGGLCKEELFVPFMVVKNG